MVEGMGEEVTEGARREGGSGECRGIKVGIGQSSIHIFTREVTFVQCSAETGERECALLLSEQTSLLWTPPLLAD